MPSFRLITEGVTDQITLEIILSIFYDDPDIDVESLQPPRDETDKYKQKKGEYGGWLMIFEYLESLEFREAIDFADYFIIQIDTDVSREFKFNVPYQEAGEDLTPGEIFERVKEVLISKIGSNFYNTYKSKFLFAICIHSIECWFLPLYFTDKRKSKIVNCLDTLNRQLARKERFTINKKDPRYYERITKKYHDKENLRKLANHNPSFKIFLDNLPRGK